MERVKIRVAELRVQGAQLLWAGNVQPFQDLETGAG